MKPSDARRGFELIIRLDVRRLVESWPTATEIAERDVSERLTHISIIHYLRSWNWTNLKVMLIKLKTSKSCKDWDRDPESIGGRSGFEVSVRRYLYAYKIHFISQFFVYFHFMSFETFCNLINLFTFSNVIIFFFDIKHLFIRAFSFYYFLILYSQMV